MAVQNIFQCRGSRHFFSEVTGLRRMCPHPARSHSMSTCWGAAGCLDIIIARTQEPPKYIAALQVQRQMIFSVHTAIAGRAKKLPSRNWPYSFICESQLTVVTLQVNDGVNSRLVDCCQLRSRIEDATTLRATARTASLCRQ